MRSLCEEVVLDNAKMGEGHLIGDRKIRLSGISEEVTGHSHAQHSIIDFGAVTAPKIGSVSAVAYDNMPRCTNKWGTPNKYDKDTGNIAPASITKSSKTDHTRTLRSHISTLNP